MLVEKHHIQSSICGHYDEYRLEFSAESSRIFFCDFTELRLTLPILLLAGVGER